MISDALQVFTYGAGQTTYDISKKLFSINKSIAGQGVRDTLDILVANNILETYSL
jgi:aminopeptidase-like protein